MLFSPAGRDDSDNFFAIGFLPVNVNHSVNGKPTDSPYGVPPRFARFSVDAVWDDEETLIGKHARGELEPDAVVLSLVQPILLLVPFEAHRIYIVYI
jgi:hypothetical protein